MEPRSITLLAETGDIRLPARIAERDGRRLTLILDRAVERDAAIRIDVEDQVLLGEVLWCARMEDGFSADIELDQAITSLHDLSRLVDALMAQDAARPDRRQRERRLP